MGSSSPSLKEATEELIKVLDKEMHLYVPNNIKSIKDAILLVKVLLAND